MRKVRVLLLTIGVMFASGCTKSNQIPNSTNQVVDASNSKLSTQVNSTFDQTGNVDNSCFFKSNILQMNYEGNFLFDDIVEKNVTLNINEMASFKDGKLYELKLDFIEGVPIDRLCLGNFYVQKDKIYKIELTEEYLNKLKTGEGLPDSSVIVCQDKELKDTLSKDETGFHYYLEVDGDKREYHSYNNQVSTGYYESFTWEKGKGLINYRSGYGAERDSIELQLRNN